MSDTTRIHVTVSADPDSWGGDTTEEEGIVYAERYAEWLRAALVAHYPAAQIEVEIGNEERESVHVPAANPDYPGASDVLAESDILEHLAYLENDVFAEFCDSGYDDPPGIAVLNSVDGGNP